MSAVANTGARKWTLLALLCATFVVYTIIRALLGPLAIPIQAETGITDIQFGILNAAVFWTFAAVVSFSGFVGDRFDRAKIIAFASVAWSVMTVLAGCATGFWSLLVLVSVAVTLPQTLYAPAAYPLIAQTHRKTRTIAIACHQGAFYVGWLLSGVSVAGVLALFGSWRAAYFAFGTLGLVIALVFYVCFARRRTQSSGTDEKGAEAASKPRFSETAKAFFGCPSAVLAALGHVSFTFAAFGYTAWGPKFVALKFGLSTGAAGTGVMFWHFAAACAAIFAAGALTDRFVGRYPRFRLALQASSLLVAAPLLALFGWTGRLGLVWVAAAAFGVAKGAFEANSVNSIFDVVPGRCRASAIGFLNVLCGALGSLAPVGLGALSQRWGVRGLELGFLALGASLVAAAGLLCVSIFFTFSRDRLAEGAS